MDILVTRNLPASVVARLREAGSVDVHTDGTMTPEVLRQRIAGKDAVIALMSDQIDKSVIDAAARLKIVANVAVGYNNVDVTYARSKQIVVTNTQDVLTG